MVNASALGFDLVRLPGGARTAEVLLTACEAGPDGLAHLAALHPGADRETRWQGVRERTRALRPVLSAVDLAGPVLDGRVSELDGSATDLLTRIAEAPLGDLDDLAAFVRTQALEETWVREGDVAVQDPTARLAADVLLDAATSAYCGDLLDDPERRSLVHPFLQARRSGGLALPAPATATLGALLDEVAHWGAGDRTALVTAVEVGRSGTSGWAAAMHEAGWAALFAGRTRLAAVAQLQAVVAFHAAGFTVTEAAGGAWNAVSGVVQALVVADLLGVDELDLLLQPWLLARGSDPR